MSSPSNAARSTGLGARTFGVVASVVILAGGHTIYRAIESNQQWIWILFQAAILLFGLLVIMVISGITKE